MLYNQNNLNCAKIASKREIKPELASVFFTKDKTVATDGVRLLEVGVPSNVNVAEWVKVDGITAMRGCKPFMVNAKMLADKVKLPKRASLPILECATISHIADGHFVEFITTDLETTSRNRVAKVEGNFPNYEQVFPTGEPVAEITINAESLAGLLEVMGKLENKVKISFYGKNKAMVLGCKDSKQVARGMMMGMVE